MAERSGEDPDVLHCRAQIAIVSGLAGGNEDAFELMLSVRPRDVRGHFNPDVALLEVTAARQGGVCAICGGTSARADGDRALVIDHDHVDGRVRALLCNLCNAGIGH